MSFPSRACPSSQRPVRCKSAVFVQLAGRVASLPDEPQPRRRFFAAEARLARCIAKNQALRRRVRCANLVPGECPEVVQRPCPPDGSAAARSRLLQVTGQRVVAEEHAEPVGSGRPVRPLRLGAFGKARRKQSGLEQRIDERHQRRLLTRNDEAAVEREYDKDWQQPELLAHAHASPFSVVHCPPEWTVQWRSWLFVASDAAEREARNRKSERSPLVSDRQGQFATRPVSARRFLRVATCPRRPLTARFPLFCPFRSLPIPESHVPAFQAQENRVAAAIEQ